MFIGNCWKIKLKQLKKTGEFSFRKNKAYEMLNLNVYKCKYIKLGLWSFENVYVSSVRIESIWRIRK